MIERVIGRTRVGLPETIGRPPRGAAWAGDAGAVGAESLERRLIGAATVGSCWAAGASSFDAALVSSGPEAGPASFAGACLADLLHDEPRRLTLAKAGFDRAKEFTWSSSAEVHVSTWNRVSATPL